MENLSEITPESLLPDLKTMLASLMPLDLTRWDLGRYYEAMGLDLYEDEENENGDQ